MPTELDARKGLSVAATGTFMFTCMWVAWTAKTCRGEIILSARALTVFFPLGLGLDP